MTLDIAETRPLEDLTEVHRSSEAWCRKGVHSPVRGVIGGRDVPAATSV